MPRARLSRAQIARAFEIALEALRTDRVRTRSALVALGIAMAIVVCLATLVERGRAATIRALEDAGLSNLYLVSRSSEGRAGKVDRHLTTADVARLANVYGSVATVSLRVLRKDFLFQGSPVSVPVYAVAGDLRRVLRSRTRGGRVLGALDVERKSPYCVVGADIRRLARLPEGLGGVISTGDRGYQVVGELAAMAVETTAASEIPSIEWNRAVLVPLGTEPEAVSEADERYPVDFAVLEFDGLQKAQDAATAMGRLLDREPQPAGYRVMSPLQTLRQYKASRRTFDRLIWLVCLLTGASAVFGISNQLSASVIARTREIGVRRAVGARALDIVIQFQAEGVLLGVLGGGIGLLAGALVSLLTSDGRGGVSLSLASFAALAAACVVLGILMGLRPAARAARIDPAAALREG